MDREYHDSPNSYGRDDPNQTPYGAGDGFYNETSGFYSSAPKKKSNTNWLKIGIPVAIIVIVGAVVGGVLGSKAAANKNTANSSGSSGGTGGNGGGGNGGGGSGNNNGGSVGAFAISTDSNGWPVYPTTTDTAAYTQPTFDPAAANKWPADTFQTTDPNPTTVRPDRPRLIAPKYKWDALPNLVKVDPYMKAWNDAIIAKAEEFAALPLVHHEFDGGATGSGILDPARDVKRRLKAYAYSYRMTTDTKWIDRAWAEINNAATWVPEADKWNTPHFLDTAELTAAFGIAYDWLYDSWNDQQKATIRDSIVNFGLNYGLAALRGEEGSGSYGWWTGAAINGNWNCVSNGGMIIGALAILGDDTTTAAQDILPIAVANATRACVNGPSTDGTWSETSDYWYFGTTGHAEMTSALLTATGGDYGLLETNPNFKDTGAFHIYVSGMTAKFNYGDHGPNKYSTTANSMLFYGSEYNIPVYTLWQRDRDDAPTDPWSMFWYDPSVKGAWWANYPLDHYFEDPADQWASMRSTWTDNKGLFVAVKGGRNVGHQTHNDLDAGDFVLDAMGLRWAGELGSANYIATDYFSNDTQASARWHWYRKMTEGQNTIALNGQNQDVNAQPTVQFESSGTVQGASTVMNPPKDSTAYFVADLASAYFGAAIKRGVRLLNGRKQVLIQDEITNVPADTRIQWRMHTNATVTIDGATATLTLADKTTQVTILDPPAGFTFERLDPVRTDLAPQLLPGQERDQENKDVSVLAISVPGDPAGTITLRVLFNPQWDGMAGGDFVTPPAVALEGWSLTSHN